MTDKAAPGDAASSQKPAEDKVAKKAETPGDGKTSPDSPDGDDDPAKREEEKLKKKKAKHAEYMRFYRSVFECPLTIIF